MGYRPVASASGSWFSLAFLFMFIQLFEYSVNKKFAVHILVTYSICYDEIINIIVKCPELISSMFCIFVIVFT